MPDPHAPNLEIPLATSYNERGSDGYATTVTSGKDQRKINCMYEPVRNSMTGKSTLYLTKRPGVTINANSFGTTGQTAYIVCGDIESPGPWSVPSAVDQFVLNVTGTTVRASTQGANATIATGASKWPQYYDVTIISGSPTGVVQVYGDSTYYSVNPWGTWTAIADADFTGIFNPVGKMEHLGGFAFIMSAGSAGAAPYYPAAVFNSNINSLSSWSAAGQFPINDYDIGQGLARLETQLIAFGSQTMTIMVNAGNQVGSPLRKERVLDYGLAPLGQGHYYARLGGRIYWVGVEAGHRGFGIFSYNGQTVERVSTLFIDKLLQGLYDSSGRAIESVNTITFGGAQALAFAMTKRSASTQRWLMFFPRYNDWFEWESTVFSPINNGVWFLGVGANQHKLYTFGEATYGAQSGNVWQDNGTDYTMTAQFKLPTGDNSRKRMAMAGVIGDKATATSTLNVEFTDDDYVNFSTARGIDMTAAMKQITRCGSFFDRAVRLTHIGNVECRLEKFIARIT